jgi:hypothetical protein
VNEIKNLESASVHSIQTSSREFTGQECNVAGKRSILEELRHSSGFHHGTDCTNRIMKGNHIGSFKDGGNPLDYNPFNDWEEPKCERISLNSLPMRSGNVKGQLDGSNASDVVLGRQVLR